MKKQYYPWNKCKPKTIKSSIMVGNLLGGLSYRSFTKRGMGAMPKNKFWVEFNNNLFRNQNK
jgi:hypothetical protein